LKLATGAEMRVTGIFRSGAVVCVGGGQHREVDGTWSASLEWLVERLAPRLAELGFAGEEHASRAVEAARSLIHETGNDGEAPWVPIGVGVHTGVAYVGRVGEGDACDFTAVGDAVNTTARLASSAGAGEILVSKAAADASMLDATGLEERTLTLRGKDEMIDALVLAA
jgi:class 3 adenylate cyclase